MHTRVDILLKSVSLEPDCLVEVGDEMKRVIGSLERVGNRFDESSEISSLNRLPAGERVRLSPDLYRILSLCLDYNVRTQGLFDITACSPGYDASTRDAVHLFADGSFCRDNTDVILDLSGFLKGYALDCLRPVLKEHGVEDALVSMGNSSIMAMGDVPGPVKDGCLTTSGNDSEERCHIMDSRSGEMIRGKRSAQVVTPGGAEGEVLATCRFVAGEDFCFA